MKQTIIGFIFARGGSKGVPRKNIRLLGGKPLIAYSIEAARECELVDRIIVSTDDEEIAGIARKHGTLTEKGEKMDVFVSIPTTSPLRLPGDVDDCIRALLDGDADIVITASPAARNPYFNMVTLDKDGCARPVIAPDMSVYRRQDAPDVYDITTVAYATRPKFVLSADSMFEGKVQAVIVPQDRALDIDTELDFMFAEFMLRQGERG
jgi:N-acylneuraminate cytidylyltransferase